MRALRGRAAPVLALLSLFYLFSACSREADWEFYLEDTAGGRIGLPLAAGAKGQAVYLEDAPFDHQIGFQLFFRDEPGGWKLISLTIEKPDPPAPEAVCDLHAEDLPPGEYRVVLFRNDAELAEQFFAIAPPVRPAPSPRISPAVPFPGSSTIAAAKFAATPSPALAPEAPRVTPSAVRAEALQAGEGSADPEMPPEESSPDEVWPYNLPFDEIPRDEVPPPPPPEPPGVADLEAEELGPGSWDLELGTGIMVAEYGEDGWHPATVIGVSAGMFTVRYLDPSRPEEVLDRERFRVRALEEGMRVRFPGPGDEPVSAAVVTVGEGTCTVVTADGEVRQVGFESLLVTGF